MRAQAACAAFYSKIKQYFDAGKYTDVSITCQDRVFRCHRLVLAAASEYFDAMFGRNFEESRAQDVVLHDIDHRTFESVLHFMYKGTAPAIGDEDVYCLLRAASILNLRDIEERCIHYLTERNMPMNNAVEIYLFACVIGNKTLISCASQSILKDLPHVSKNDLFLRMSFEELSTLLEFASPGGSSKKEYVLLNTIRRWVSNQICSQEEKESLFLKLTQNVCFRHIPVVFSDVCRDAVLQSDLDVTGSEVENPDPSLHVYVDLEYGDPRSLTTLFSREKFDEKWHPSHDIVPPIKYMRTVVHDNQLYSFQLNGMNNAHFAFIASSSVDFSENVRSLATPPPELHEVGERPHLSVCCQKNGIYACSKYSNELFHYNCEQDRWFPISLSTKEEFSPTLITMCHNQLYIIVSDSNGVNMVQTYDDRTGKLGTASKSSLYYTHDSEVCTHKERIYLSGCSWDVHMEVYNPVANKWVKILEEPSSDDRRFPLSSHRLASFENKLWMFTAIDVSLSFSSLQQMIIKRYDSFTEEWDQDDYSLNYAIVNDKCVSNDFLMGLTTNLTDAIVYKLPQ